MNEEDNIDWFTLLRRPIVTAQHNNGNKRIVAATEILQQTAQQFAKVLNDRARLLANSAQYKAALRDAAAIRVMLPGSGLGYLCTGDVYCQQGRYAAAIAIYDQGLQAVPQSDLYLHQLQQHRMIAMTNNNKRVDFISQLPLDIVVTNILPRVMRIMSSIASCESCELLYVSRAWQERILKQPNGLTFQFGLDMDVNTLKHGHDPLVRFAPYVQNLHGTLLGHVCLDDLFSRANFSKLKRLELSCDESTPRRPLLNGLALIADSLTHLTIDDCRSVQLRDILESCPNLVSLAISGVDTTMPSSSSIRFPNLTHLALGPSTRTSRTNDDVVDILSRFPSLLCLEIAPMRDSSALIVLQQQCPYLQVLCYDGAGLDPEAKNIPSQKKGITSAYLSGYLSYDQDHLIQFLLSNQHSLEIYDFEGENIIKNRDAIWEISNGRLEQRNPQQSLQLTSQQSGPLFTRLLNFRSVEEKSSSAAPFMQWVLLNSPNLKAIDMSESLFQPDVANAMIQLKHLSKLKIDYVNASDDDNSNYISIKQFLEHHIALGDRSTLEHVIVDMDDVDMSEVTWISLLCRLKCIKKLELITVNMGEHCRSILEEIGQGCPSLEELTLGLEETEMAEGLLAPLRQLSNLKCLTLGAWEICNTDFLVVASFNSLERLYLRCDISDDMLVLLESRIPKVVA